MRDLLKLLERVHGLGIPSPRRGRGGRGARRAGRQQASQHATVAPSRPGRRSRQMLEDIAILTGGRMIAEELGIKLDTLELTTSVVPLGWCGRMRRSSSAAQAQTTTFNRAFNRSKLRSRDNIRLRSREAPRAFMNFRWCRHHQGWRRDRSGDEREEGARGRRAACDAGGRGRELPGRRCGPPACEPCA